MSELELTELDLALSDTPIPLHIAKLIAEARETVETFHLQRRQKPVIGFHASDFELAFRLLEELANHLSHKTDIRFVEWGSGIPCVSLMANLLGWQSFAIECDRELVEFGRFWLNHHSHCVETLWASFVPSLLPETIGRLPTNEGVRRAPVNVEALPLTEIRGDVVYAYPWPGEAEFFEQLFLASSQTGDILVLYHGSLMYDVFRSQERSSP